jgi:hypothetical protein
LLGNPNGKSTKTLRTVTGTLMNGSLPEMLVVTQLLNAVPLSWIKVKNKVK